MQIFLRFYKKLTLALMMVKPLILHMLTIIVRPVFEDEGKFYPQVYLDESVYEL